MSGTWRGREAIISAFLGGVGMLLQPGSPLTIELTNVISDGAQVVAERTSRATGRDGAAYHHRNLGVFTVRDGKITSVRIVVDEFLAIPGHPHIFAADDAARCQRLLANLAHLS